MGSDYVMLDTWRKVYFNKKGEEFIVVQSKRILIEDLKRYVDVHNASWSQAINEYLKQKVK